MHRVISAACSYCEHVVLRLRVQRVQSQWDNRGIIALLFYNSLRNRLWRARKKSKAIARLFDLLYDNCVTRRKSTCKRINYLNNRERLLIQSVGENFRGNLGVFVILSVVLSNFPEKMAETHLKQKGNTKICISLYQNKFF